ncbi:SDR family oxidoreductase [Marinobacter alexandrii]|jgi:NAD(P)-dependent dehydrogenase (short-subunit alcohol dehydrogenase family)|uniref:SDR family oxidoreductase n=1 Tax=Marinobacter alexandrii TaxID=2570351 RepID=UPI002ABDC69D|nr:SDR family oxidoreductase [Marinobacter alexandrii]
MSEKRTVVITGANRGIGLELARHFAGEGCDVIGVCREASAELTDVAARVIEGIDVTKDAGIDKLTDALAGERIDLLINNAGLLQDEKLGSIDFDSIRIQMEINAYAPLRVTEALVSQIPSGGKIANITSRMGSIADNDSGGRYGYRASKAALNAFGKSLAVDLKPRGIAVAQLHPGYVQTRMVNFGGLISPEESAKGLAARIEGLSLESTGSFWHSNGEALPW